MKHSPPSDDWQNGGFGLYVHWPYCSAKCPYCDFNSHVAGSIDHHRWAEAYKKEIARAAEALPARKLDSIFFGGGTPSLMLAETVDTVIKAAKAAWQTPGDLEVTLEANPTSIEAGRFFSFADAGVNRLSIGVQALSDADLRKLGRMHSAAEALDSIALARRVFPRVSFDLIYARQDQSRDDWRDELLRALDLEPDHLSLYQLTIEDGTPFAQRRARGKLRGLPDEDLAADLYELTQDLTTTAGLPAYEVSNHARPGSESHHNLIYWRYGDFVGIGPGAHGRITYLDGERSATEAEKAPELWLRLVEGAQGGATTWNKLDPVDAAEEMLMMGLRLEEGIAPSRFRDLAGYDLPATAIDELIGLGMLSTTARPGRITCTASGRKVLNAIIARLLG